MKQPSDAEARRAVPPVIAYSPLALDAPDLPLYRAAREQAVKVEEIYVAPREGACFRVGAGQFFRIVSVDGPQVGDMNLWADGNLSERFYSGKTRALHGTHISAGDRLWSCLPYLRPMATVIEDTLDWYGIDEFGGVRHNQNDSPIYP